RHDRRSRHAPACPGRLARCGVVGAAARGPRAHALRRPGPEAAARSGDGWRARSPRDGPARPRPVDPGAGGVRRVRELIHVSDQGILIYFLALNSFYVVLMILSRARTRLLVVDKENGGKADSLNAAINASRFPLVIAVDADTLIEPDAMLRLTRPFLLGRHIAAVGGTVRVADSCAVAHGRVTDARVPRRF